MGFAKFHEDLVSRNVADMHLHTRAVPFAHAAAAQGGPAAEVPSSGGSTGKASRSSTFAKFTVAAARPLPVIVLADTSGSMAEAGKIEALNAAVREMVSAFADGSRLRAEIQVAVITFGPTAVEAVPLAAAHQLGPIPTFAASGATPMGGAFAIARALIEDESVIPSRAYRPVMVLISDGNPTDEWEYELEQLRRSDRAQKAVRLAMAIGADANATVLKDFVNDLEAPVFGAHNARDIHRFFRAVTMSVVALTVDQASPQSSSFVVPDIGEDALDLNF